MKTVFRTLLACMLLFAGFGVSLAQDPIEEKQLIKVAQMFIDEGYEITHEVPFGSIAEGEDDTYSFELEKDVEYHIISACDEDCGDIDLYLLDENDNDIDSDVERDDRPMISVTPAWTGQFTLRVEMFNCEIEPCRFGIVVVGK